MVSFDDIFLYSNVAITNRLSIIKNYVDNGDQFTRKVDIPQDKFLDLVNLVLTTTWYIFNYNFYQKTHGVAIGGPAFSTTTEIYIILNTMQCLRHWTLQKVGNYFMIKLIQFLNVCT